MIGSSTTKLVSVKTCGGLLNATDGMLCIFAIMEKQFRIMFGEGVECVVEMSENFFCDKCDVKGDGFRVYPADGLSMCWWHREVDGVEENYIIFFIKLELTIKLGNCWIRNVTTKKLNWKKENHCEKKLKQ